MSSKGGRSGHGSLAPSRTADPPHKRPTFAVGFRAVYVGRWADSRSAVVGWGGAPNLVGNNSRFRAFHSRLSRYDSRFASLPEFAVNDLIWLPVFAAKWRFSGETRKISRFHGNSRECAPPA